MDRLAALAPVTMLRVYCTLAGSVRDDELAAGRSEVPIRDVDGNALFPLGPETIGEVGQIDLAASGDVGGAFQRLDLVLHQRLRVVKQAADQGGFAVIDAAARVEAQNIDDGMRRSKRRGRCGNHGAQK